MLISVNRDRTRRGGGENLIALIPELCRPTGLTDAMKRDFRLGRMIGEVTRPVPEQRVNLLHGFCQRVLNQVDSVRVLRDWQFNIDDTLVTFEGRRLDSEKIQFGNEKT